MKKRILCLLLLCCLAVTLFAVTVSAAGEVKCSKGHTDVTRLEGRYGHDVNDWKTTHYPLYNCNTCGGNVSTGVMEFIDRNSPEPHTLVWKQVDDAYKRVCTVCDISVETRSLTLQGADRVCATQKYTYSFTLPAGITEFETGYEAAMKGGELTATEENGVYTVVMEPEWYDDSSGTFVVSVIVKASDGTPLKFEKTVTLLAHHVSDPAATCTTAANCEVCGVSYLDPENHSGTAQWSITPTRHGKLYDCCDAVAMADEPHNWESGVCKDCGASCIHDGGEATCTAPAVCTICGESYGDVDADNHSDIRHIEKNDATETADGNIEYWFCADCGKYFSDPNFSKEITQAETVIPKLTDDSKDDGKKNESAKEAEVKTAPSATPQTDDGSGYAQLIAISALSVCAAASAAILLKGRKKSSDNSK